MIDGSTTCVAPVQDLKGTFVSSSDWYIFALDLNEHILIT